MLESAIRLYAWNLQYAAALIADLTQEQATESGGLGLENHPAWTIGHLVTGADLLAEDLGLERDLPARVAQAWREKRASGTELEAPLTWRFGAALPTLGDATLFLAISHEAMHLGQLAAWRRARGLPSALNAL